LQDGSPGFAGSRWIGEDAQDYILGYSQPSLAGLLLGLMSTQDYVLGYFQPSLRDWVIAGADRPLSASDESRVRGKEQWYPASCEKRARCPDFLHAAPSKGPTPTNFTGNPGCGAPVLRQGAREVLGR
jgi:hypothetical protein